MYFISLGIFTHYLHLRILRYPTFRSLVQFTLCYFILCSTFTITTLSTILIFTQHTIPTHVLYVFSDVLFIICIITMIKFIRTYFFYFSSSFDHFRWFWLKIYALRNFRIICRVSAFSFSKQSFIFLLLYLSCICTIPVDNVFIYLSICISRVLLIIVSISR